MTHPKPKCTSAIVIATFADGSRILVDVKDPTTFVYDFEMIDIHLPTSSGQRHTLVTSPAELVVRVRINPEEPAIVSAYPSKR